MVNAAESDIIGPAIAAEDPVGLLCQIILVLQDILSLSTSVCLKSLHKLIGCRSVGLSIQIGIKPCLTLGCNLALGHHRLNLALQALSECISCQEHTETELSRILEQGVRPSRAMSLLVDRVRCGR